MLFSNHAYVPEWLQRQLVADGLLPRSTDLKMPWGMSMRSTDGMIFELGDPAVDQVLDQWFASFRDDPPINSPITASLRPVLVKLPDLIVPTEVRLTSELHLPGMIGLSWAASWVEATAFVEIASDIPGSYPAFLTERYSLVQVGAPMTIDRSLYRPRHG